MSRALIISYLLRYVEDEEKKAGKFKNNPNRMDSCNALEN